MDIKIHQDNAVVLHSYRLQYALLENELYAYRLEFHAEGTGMPAAFAKRLAPMTREGLATRKALAAFKSGAAADIEGKGTRPLVVVSEDFAADVQRLGFMAALERLHAGPWFKNGDGEKFFTALVEQQVPLDRCVQVDIGSHMVFDRFGEVLPTAMYCDYMAAGMHNGKYDLDLALKVLKKDPRVRFMHPDARRGRNGSAADVIHAIPHYNCDETHSAFLSFWFMPTLEDARKLWVVQKELNPQYPSTQFHGAVEKLDLLGLVAAGALLCPTQ